MRDTRFARVNRARERAEDHIRWVEDHGGDLAGYIERYGRASDPDHYGDGGEAIYAADIAAKERAMDDLFRLRGD